MESSQDDFELDFKNMKVKVSRHSINDQVIFKIIFPDKRKPLVVTRVRHADAYKFWTSIPEGRQREAEELGPSIVGYFKSIQ